MQGSNSGDGWSYEKFSCVFTSRERGPGQTLQHRVFLFKIKISTGRHFQCILLIRESHKARFQVSGVHIRDGGAVSANILCTVRNIRYGVYYRCSGGKQLYVETPPTGEHDLLSLTVNPGPVAPVRSKAFPPEGQVGQRVRCSYAAEP